MQGKTHAAIGCACVLFIQTQVFRICDVRPIFTAAAAGCLASLLPDIDTNGQKLKKKITAALTAAVITACIQAVIYAKKNGMFPWQDAEWCTTAYSEALKAVPGIALLIAFLLLGVAQKHRGFTHSFAALGIAAFSAYLLSKEIWPYAAIGYASHLLADLPNRMGLQLFFPYKKRFAFYWCTSDGMTDAVLFYLALIASAACICSL